ATGLLEKFVEILDDPELSGAVGVLHGGDQLAGAAQDPGIGHVPQRRVPLTAEAFAVQPPHTPFRSLLARQELPSAPPPGLEPGLSEPKSEVLPITLRRIAPGQDSRSEIGYRHRGSFASPSVEETSCTVSYGNVGKGDLASTPVERSETHDGHPRRLRGEAQKRTQTDLRWKADAGCAVRGLLRCHRPVGRPDRGRPLRL